MTGAIVADADQDLAAMEDEPPRPRSSGRRIATLLAIAGLTVVVGAAWAFSSPVGSSPDDDFHLGSIWCSDLAPAEGCVEGPRTPGFYDRSVDVPAPVARQTLDCFIMRPSEAAGCATSAADRPGLFPSRANFNYYPGGFYDLMAPLVSDRPAASVLGMRLLSWVLCCGLIGASLAVAERRTRQAFLIALVVSAVPLGLFIFASTNPSGLAVAGTFTFACALTTFLTSTSRRRTVAGGVLAVVGASAALISRSDAGIWISVAAAATVLLTGIWRWPWQARLVLPAAVVVAGAIAVMALTADFASEGLSFAPNPRPFRQVVFKNLTELPTLWTGSLGTFPLGWSDTAMPSIVSVGMVGAYVAVLAIGLRRPSGGGLAALGLILLSITVVPLYALAGDGSVIPEDFQPRYLLPIIAVVPAIAVLGGRAVGAGALLSRSQKIFILIAVGLAQLAALHTNMRRYVWGADRLGFNLNRDRSWWWPWGPRPMVVWAVGSLAFVALLVLLLFGIDRSRDPS
ncbi:MAG: DUF2142 domain-containing protein [Ilumatobacteraceae bacterium]